MYKAYDTARKRHVAIKRSDVKPSMKNFTLQREVQLANEIPAHDHVLRFENTFRFRMGHNEVDYAIMPFYKNGNLNAFLKANNLSLSQKQALVMGILKGIKHLHDNEFIHRDLKSGNILIDDNGKPIIIDFGLSKLNARQDMSYSNSAIGKSFEYAAPNKYKTTPFAKILIFGRLA